MFIHNQITKTSKLIYACLFIVMFTWLAALPHEGQGVSPALTEVLFQKIPKVALLLKEYYSDPKRINPDAMMASVLELLESRIPQLVITSKSLKKTLREAKSTQNKESSSESSLENEPIIVDIGGVKKSFTHEKNLSIWGMVFSLREILRLIQEEMAKQGLTIDNPNNQNEPIDLAKLESGIINAFLYPLDPHSNYLEAKYAKDLTLATKGEFGGVGIVISIRNGSLVVISPIEGTPAFKAGVKANDKIVKIDDDSAINMDLNEAVEKLRGKPNTDVRITLQRADSKDIEVKLKRAIIKVDSVSSVLVDDNIGYLKIKAFQGNTASDVKEAILSMKKTAKGKMKALVLDLRGNPGGLLREAVEVSSLFLPAGEEVVSTIGSKPESKQIERAISGPIDPNLIVAVLVDGGSASASEIVAGALKHCQSIVIGENTFGKGSVQMVFDFPSEKGGESAALKLTIAEYFGPNNKSIQNIGVSPDVALIPVNIDKLESLKLFPKEDDREKDLEGHLETTREVVYEKPLINIKYIMPVNDNDLDYSNKINIAKLNNDFTFNVAKKILYAAKASNRDGLLASAKSIESSLQSAENKKIIEGLKKYNIDWSSGETKGRENLLVSIVDNKAVKAGDKMKVTIKVKNVGKETYFQVHGITHAKTDLFKAKEFLFGKILPGEEVQRYVMFDIPKDPVSRIDLLDIKLADYREEDLGSISVPLEIQGLKRPKFAYLTYINDINGNANGSVQQGEDAEIVVWLKNVGEGKAFEPTILLKNESGSKIFLKNGRFVGKEMLPNEEISTKFAFRVKEITEQALLELQIFDSTMGDIYRDKITIPVHKFHLHKSSVINKPLSLKNDKTELWAMAKDNSPKIALLTKTAHILGIRELPEYYLVKIDSSLSGYVKKSEVVDKKAKDNKQSASLGYEILYHKIPAKLSMKFIDGIGYATEEKGKVIADIANTKDVTALLLYVNGKKVLYKEMKNMSGSEKLEHLVYLEPGVNYITLLAQQGKVFGQKENITVYYDKEQKIKSFIRNTDKKSATINIPLSRSTN